MALQKWKSGWHRSEEIEKRIYTYVQANKIQWAKVSVIGCIIWFIIQTENDTDQKENVF